MRTVHTLTEYFPVTSEETVRRNRGQDVRAEPNEVAIEIAIDNPGRPHTVISITAKKICVSKISNGKKENSSFTIQELVDIAFSEKRIVYMVKP